MFDNDEVDGSKWRTVNIKLGQNDSWTKPSGIVHLRNASFAVPIDDHDYKGILSVESWNEPNAVLCVLFPHEPSKDLNIIFGYSKNVCLINQGNRDITVSMLVKRGDDEF